MHSRDTQMATAINAPLNLHLLLTIFLINWTTMTVNVRLINRIVAGPLMCVVDLIHQY